MSKLNQWIAVCTSTIKCNRLSRTFKAYLRRRPYSYIDPKIRPLVDAMNATGVIHTIASCQGHGKFGKPPYVYFKSPIYVAASIERHLREAEISGDVHLNEMWIVQAAFNEQYELVFSLQAPAYHEKAFTLWAPVVFWLLRKRLNAELLHLVKIIQKAMLL